MNIEKAKAISGYMYPEDLVWLAERASSHRRIVEVGSWKGKSTRAMAENTQGIVYAVDTWKGSAEHLDLLKDNPEGWLKEEFLRNMEGLDNVRPVQMTSLEAAESFQGQRFDMIFIDAEHHYEAVKADILAWRSLLSPGGLLCGHDYATNTDNMAGLVAAVDELVPDRSLTPPVTEWMASIWYWESPSTGAGRC